MSSFITSAQNPQLKTTINKQNILIGEPLKIRVEANFPVNTYKITWLTIPDSIAHFEVIERQKTDSIESNGMLKVQQIITLTSFDSGIRTIPSFLVNFDAFSDDSAFNLFTDSIRVAVSFAPTDSIKPFHDIKTIIEVKDERPLWVWIVAGLVVLLLIFLIYYLLKKLRKKNSSNLFASNLSPLEEALQSLTELQKQQLLSKHQVKQFHSRLSEIFKRYMSAKINFNLLNLTSEQVLMKLDELYINKENIGLVANNLLMADAVKFAKYVPGNTESEEAFSNTKKVIQQIDQSIINSKSGI
ncbi:MAG: hypothetical protein ABIN97_05995 [Ginsengibacter sp.]